MFYTIYKITNTVNDKIYIGKHQTKNLDDDYFGSGKLIIRAIEKYGVQNFTKEILYVFDTEEDMNLKEAEIVDQEFCLREDTYNLCPGGTGGWGYINSSGIDKFKGKNHSLEAKALISESSRSRVHTKETREKISKASKGSNESRGRKVSAALKNKPKTKEHKENLSQSVKSAWSQQGVHPNLGRKFPDRKRRESVQYKEIECPHCGKIGASNAMRRWHFDNCKAFEEQIVVGSSPTCRSNNWSD